MSFTEATFTKESERLPYLSDLPEGTYSGYISVFKELKNPKTGVTYVAEIYTPAAKETVDEKGQSNAFRSVVFAISHPSIGDFAKRDARTFLSNLVTICGGKPTDENLNKLFSKATSEANPLRGTPLSFTVSEKTTKAGKAIRVVSWAGSEVDGTVIVANRATVDAGYKAQYPDKTDDSPIAF